MQHTDAAGPGSGPLPPKVTRAAPTEPGGPRLAIQPAAPDPAAVLRHVPGVVAHFRADGTLLFLSPSAAHLFGVDPTTYVGRLMSDVLHPDDGATLFDFVAEAIANNGSPISVVLRARDADGRGWRPVELVGVNVSGDPSLRGIVASVHPVGDNRAAPATSPGAPRDESAVFDATTNLVLVVDATGTVLKMNRAAEQALGVRSNEALGQLVGTVVREDGGSDSLEAALRRTAATGEAVALEGDVSSVHGERRRVQWETGVLAGRPGGAPRLIATGVDVTAQRDAENALLQIEAQSRHASRHDPLTGLANRTLLFERLEHALENPPRAGSRVAVLFVDLDRFKLVNDSFGHGAGDRLLCEVAGRLTLAVRGHDTVARLGGDEFVVLLEGVPDEGPAIAVAERLLAVLQPPVTINGFDNVIGASIGISVSRPTSSADDLLAEADSAMYRAKAAGKGRYELFDDHLREEVLLRMETESDLRRGIERDELVTWFQPQVNLRTGAIVGLEALVRWQHPQRGLLGPGAFLPIAEEAGLIDKVWDTVVLASLRQLAAWREEYPHHRELRMSVNLSTRQLSRPGLVSELAGVLRDQALPAECVCVEVTEGSLNDVRRAVRTIDDLRALGIQVSIDDFGTGVATLAHLRMFSVDELKVDQVFVANVATSPVDHGIVAAVVELARAVGAQMVAEGIETTDIARRCRQLGVVIAQGHLFSRALPPHELVADLAVDRPYAAIIRELTARPTAVAS